MWVTRSVLTQRFIRKGDQKLLNTIHDIRICQGPDLLDKWRVNLLSSLYQNANLCLFGSPNTEKDLLFYLHSLSAHWSILK